MHKLTMACLVGVCALIMVLPLGVMAENGGPVNIHEFLPVDGSGISRTLTSQADSSDIPFKEGDTIRFKGSIDNFARMNLVIYHGLADVISKYNVSTVDFTWTIPHYMVGDDIVLHVTNTGEVNGTLTLKIERTMTEEEAIAAGMMVCIGLVVIGIIIIVVIIFIIWKLMGKKKQTPVQQPYYPQQQYPQAPPQYYPQQQYYPPQQYPPPQYPPPQR